MSISRYAALTHLEQYLCNIGRPYLQGEPTTPSFVSLTLIHNFHKLALESKAWALPRIFEVRRPPAVHRQYDDAASATWRLKFDVERKDGARQFVTSR